MTASEYQKQARGSYAFDHWLWQRRVASPLGDFVMELQMLGAEDTNPPDEAMLKRSAELVRYAEAHGDYVLDLVFGYYLFAAESGNWLERCGVPTGLTKETVSAYVRNDRSLVVSRHLDWDEPYASVIYIVPLWDEEHAMYLEFHDDDIVAVNDSPFRLEAEVLRRG